MLARVWLAAMAWLAALAAVSAQTPGPARIEAWPDRPVRIVVPAPAGGASDAIARVLAQRLGEQLHQPFLVDDRPGTLVGASAVARAEPDGYLLLMASPFEVALAPHLYKSMSYDPAKDLVPISLIAQTPFVIAAHPTFPASTPDELIALIKKERVDFSHAGVGSPHHLTGEYLNALTGGHLVGISYRGGGPALTDALAGVVKLTIIGLPPTVPYLQSGALKSIAVTSARRSPLFPDIPAVAETSGLAGFDTSNWFGLVAPGNTPPALVAKLHGLVAEALKDDRVTAALKSQAAEPIGSSPADFSAFIRAESDKYGKIVALAGLTPN